MTPFVTLLALYILILAQFNNGVAASVLYPRSLKNHLIQKVTLKTEVSQEARAAIASSRNRQLVNLFSLEPLRHGRHPFQFDIVSAYKDLYGSKLFFTKVPVSIGQSGNFALSLAGSLPFTFARGPNCTGDVVSCTGATSTHYTFVGFNKGANFSADTYGDGIFSLTNGNLPHQPFVQATSWVLNAGFAPDKWLAGLYLPFYDRPNDHGELSLGGVDTSRFTGQITYSWSCTFGHLFQHLSLVPSTAPRLLSKLPRTDFVTMNDGCYQLVLDTFKPQVDPITQALIVDCAFLKNGPNVDLTIDGQMFTMVPESYIFHDTSSNVCVLLFTTIPGDLILGAPFLVNYYSKITLRTEVSKEARAAIASSRDRQLVNPDQSFKNIQTLNSKSGTVTLINTSLSPPYEDLFGGKLFFTKVPVSIGKSGNFALSLTTLQPYTFVRGPNCTGDVVSCTGPKIKSNDPDIIPNDQGFGSPIFTTPASKAQGPIVNTTSFIVGNVKSTHYTFVGFNKGIDFSTDTLGDGIFSLTNGNVADDPMTQTTSWLFNAGFAPNKLQAGLYLPFHDKPNDHGELTLGGYDSSRFTGQITY
ncbi:hypothetical protein HDU76_006268, partial [Blyttiomyces sp. JEL0837]